MNIGMLWFDNDPKAEVLLKIERAASYYHSKYGKTPNLCYIHPSMLPTSSPDDMPSRISPGIEVRTSRTVLPNHFWIGINTNVLSEA